MVTDAMIEAGCEAMHKVHAAMRDRNLVEGDEPESMDDFDEGDVCRAVFIAMYAARPTADLGEDGELVERLRALAERQRNERGDYLDRGQPDAELEQAVDRLILYREALEGLARFHESGGHEGDPDVVIGNARAVLSRSGL